MTKLLFLLTFCFSPFFLFGQHILAGELNRQVEFQRVNVAAVVVTEEALSDDKVIDWGDGHSDTLSLPVFEGNDSSYHLSHLTGQHIYADTGVYQIQINGLGTWSGQIENIEDPTSIPFVLSEEVVIVPEGETMWNAPFCLAPLTRFQIEDGGAISHEFVCTEIPKFGVDSFTYELVPPVTEGYAFPAATNELSCCIFWDRPVAEGLYAFATEVVAWRDGERLSKITRYVSLDIDESILVGENSISAGAPVLSIYPNPAQEALHLQLSHFQATDALLQVMNLQGQALYQNRLQLSPTLQTHEIQVAGWPAGVYVLRVQSGERQWVRKFVVE